MALERFKVLEIVHQNSIGMSLIKVCRLIDEEFMEFVLTKEDLMNPEYLKTKIDSEMNQYFHKKARNQKEILIDLNNRMIFMGLKEDVNDNYGDREVMIYYYLSSSNIFTNERLKKEESQYEIYEDCPNCQEVYLEVGETCEYCGYVRK